LLSHGTFYGPLKKKEKVRQKRTFSCLKDQKYQKNMFFSRKNHKKFAYITKKQYFCGLIGKNAFI